MNRHDRRRIGRRFVNSVLLTAAVLPAACAALGGGTTGGSTTIPVTLDNAKAEAVAIVQALDAAIAQVGSQLKPTTQMLLQTAMESLQTAVNAFTAVQPGASVADVADAVVKTAMSIVSLLPLPATIELAISAGLMLIEGLINGLSSITVTVPTSPTPAPTTSLRAGAVRAPIPIPTM